MRILIVHNGYLLPGGEDVVAAAEADLLGALGHTVAWHRRSNAEVAARGALDVAAGAVWSRASAAAIAAQCAAWRPDIVHFHNTFPLVSGASYQAARRSGAAVVHTLHNFRLLCPQGSFQRAGMTCRACAGTLPWRAVVRRCYHDSRAHSLAAAMASVVTRLAGGPYGGVDAYIVPSAFARTELVAAGLPGARLFVKPNFVAPSDPGGGTRDGGLFVGRLSSEKGVAVLLDAAARLAAGPPGAFAPRLRVVGAGPLSAAVAAALGPDYLGPQRPDEVRRLLQSASYLVVPSTCLETFGLAVIEAYACGVPVIAAAHGALAELVEHGVTGLHARPGSGADLAAKIAWMQAHPAAVAAMGAAALARYRRDYTPQRNGALLETIYRGACAHRQGASHAH